MTRGFALVAALTVVLTSSTGAIPVRSHHELRTPQVKKIGNLSLEFVGQFQNSPPGVTPVTHIHYGYLSYIQGTISAQGTTSFTGSLSLRNDRGLRSAAATS